MDCIRTTWISSVGKYLERFEKAFAEVAGTRHAIGCSNGTTALHLALLALGVQPDDEVIVPTLTFVAVLTLLFTAVQSLSSWMWIRRSGVLMHPKSRRQITAKTRGIIAVHLRGHPADMEAIMGIARRRGLFVIEDAAQAHGARVRGKAVGSIGDIGTFSFFGNKMMTTGEGGMVTTDDDAMADHIRLLKNQGMTQKRRYWHPVVGYNSG